MVYFETTDYTTAPTRSPIDQIDRQIDHIRDRPSKDRPIIWLSERNQILMVTVNSMPKLEQFLIVWLAWNQQISLHAILEFQIMQNWKVLLLRKLQSS